MRIRIAAAAVGGLAAAVLGQVDPAGGDPPPVLAGPAVHASEGRQTLVERGFDGRIRRLEVSPEEAALDRLPLDPQTRERIERVLAARWALLDRAVRENVGLLTEINSAQAAGDKAEALRLLRQMVRALEPLRAQGRLMDRIEAELPPQRREAFRAMVDEYRREVVREMIADARERGERLGPVEAGIRASLEELGRELGRSFQRMVQPAQEEFERLIVLLDLTPEQEAQVRRMVEDFAQRTLLNPSEADKRDLFWRLATVLTVEQIRTLLRQTGG